MIQRAERWRIVDGRWRSRSTARRICDASATHLRRISGEWCGDRVAAQLNSRDGLQPATHLRRPSSRKAPSSARRLDVEVRRSLLDRGRRSDFALLPSAFDTAGATPGVLVGGAPSPCRRIGVTTSRGWMTPRRWWPGAGGATVSLVASGSMTTSPLGPVPGECASCWLWRPVRAVRDVAGGRRRRRRAGGGWYPFQGLTWGSSLTRRSAGSA